MIKKISLSLIFVCLFIAIPLAMLGFKKVELGRAGMALINKTNLDLVNFKIGIPSIPMIPRFDTPSGFELVLNFLINVVNGLSTFINVLIQLWNTIIQLFQFMFVLIKNLVTFKDSVQPLIPISVGQ